MNLVKQEGKFVKAFFLNAFSCSGLTFCRTLASVVSVLELVVVSLFQKKKIYKIQKKVS